jgi:hypothetical protein
MVKEIKDKSVMLQMPDKSIVEVPCGMVVWAAVSLCFAFRFFISDGADNGHIRGMWVGRSQGT